MPSVSRMQFLRGRFRKDELVLRPPWAVAEEQFVADCTRCNECITICPEKIIQQGQGGFPEIVFSHSGCEFCEDCLAVCKPKVLNKLDKDQSAWDIKATITSKCIAYHGTICRTCGEACNDDAIHFKLEAGKVGTPILTEAQCTGCGFCIAMCPVDAIVVSSVSIPSETMPNEPLNETQRVS